jgi:hypothetical protein
VGEIPGWLYQLAGEDITVEPYLGSGGYGDTWGPAVTVRGIVEEKRRLVRNSQGVEVLSNTTVRCPLGTNAPPLSKVTVRGTVTKVIACPRHDGKALPVPSHTEVVCE